METMSGISEGYGLLYCPTSPKAVTKRYPLDGLLTKKDGFKYSAVIPRSSGRLKSSVPPERQIWFVIQQVHHVNIVGCVPFFAVVQ